jgi:transposase
VSAPDCKAWTQKHERWLNQVRLEHAADQAVFDDYLLALVQVGERIKALDRRLDEVAQQEPYAERVGWLRCFRGIDTLTAISVLAELHEISRFRSARHLMSYLGLVPSEHSSGGRQSRGGITKAGNRHLRRLLIEAAWHGRHRPTVGEALKKRRVGQPAAVIALADRAQQRLSARFVRLVFGSKKPPTSAVVALARELAGFIWAVLQQPRASEA